MTKQNFSSHSTLIFAPRWHLPYNLIFIYQFPQPKKTQSCLCCDNHGFCLCYWLLTGRVVRSPSVCQTGFPAASCLTASWRKDSTLRWTPVVSSVRFWMLSTTCTLWASCTETSRCSSPLITRCAYYRPGGGHPWFFSMLKPHCLSTKPLNLLNTNDSKTRIAQQNCWMICVRVLFPFVWQLASSNPVLCLKNAWPWS